MRVLSVGVSRLTLYALRLCILQCKNSKFEWLKVRMLNAGLTN